MDSYQLAFIDDMREEISRQGQSSFSSSRSRLTVSQDVWFQNLKGLSMYKNEMFWCHQLLYDGWKADTPYHGDMLGLTEKDFMFS